MEPLRNDLSNAQAKAKALLEKPLLESVARNFADGLPFEYRPEDIILLPKGDDDFESHSDELAEPQTVTLNNPSYRDYLGILSERMGDPFVREATRNEAKKRYSVQYREFLDFTDSGDNFPKNSIRSMIAYIDAMAALADEGVRPDPQILRNGINTLQMLSEHHKSIEIRTKNLATSAEDIEDKHYREEAFRIFLFQDPDKMSKLPPELQARIKAYREDPEPSTRDPISQSIQYEIQEFLMQNQGMVSQDYQKIASSSHEESAARQSDADIIRDIIQQTRAIAKDLGIDLRSMGRNNS